ncbi:MAG TPA: HPr family phosphocarrier protein [Vicinamibacterales bacterium]|nr:HPr family phosphocarrier protein [Vicinamibacterales bacterium]
MTSRTVTVTNRLGLHARAAARFVNLASRFQAQVRVTRGSQTMDGKSIMGILLLAAAAGSALTVSAEGQDEAAAVDALCGFIETGFGEDPCNA